MTTGTSRKAALKEDVKYVIEELWDAEEEEPFCKIFTRECLNRKETQKILQDSKENVQDISCRDDDGTANCLRKHEVGHVHMLVHYQSYLIAIELFPEDTDAFRFNLIARKIASLS